MKNDRKRHKTADLLGTDAIRSLRMRYLTFGKSITLINHNSTFTIR